MAFFEDLGECSYFEDLGLRRLIAVGWLEKGHAYAPGDPGREVRRRLDEFRNARWHLTGYLGGHCCEMCPRPDSLAEWRTDAYYSKTDLLIPGEGVLYAAPEGICHYVKRHDYHPPRVFCEALLVAPAADSRDYFAALQRLGVPRRWLRLPPRDTASDWP